MTDILTTKADKLAHEVYLLTKKFPKEEIFGITSQLRRAALSIILNIIEGFARNRTKEYIHFLEIAYGSLKETKYLLHFSYKESYYNNEEYKRVINLAEEVGKLLWTKIQYLKK